MLTDTQVIRLEYAEKRRRSVQRVRYVAPGAAGEALRAAREAFARDPGALRAKWRYHAPAVCIWCSEPHGGAPHMLGSTRVRWLEDVIIRGLRFAGTAQDIGAAQHSGWYMNPDSCGEVTQGVVYQLPARHGRARYLYGIDDAYGNGGACLACDDVIEADEATDAARDAARLEAARFADHLAERCAEREREYQEAYRAGSTVREAAREARKAVSEWAQRVRAARNAFATRRARGVLGITLAETLAAYRHDKDAVRRAAVRAERARAKWHTMLADQEPGVFCGDRTALDAFRAGYADA